MKCSQKIPGVTPCVSQRNEPSLANVQFAKNGPKVLERLLWTHENGFASVRHRRRKKIKNLPQLGPTSATDERAPWTVLVGNRGMANHCWDNVIAWIARWLVRHPSSRILRRSPARNHPLKWIREKPVERFFVREVSRRREHRRKEADPGRVPNKTPGAYRAAEAGPGCTG